MLCLKKNSNFKKQRNNKQKIINIKEGTIQRANLFGEVCEKVNKVNRALTLTKNLILLQKFAQKNKLWTRVFTHHGIVYDISEKVTSVITNVCVYKNGGFLGTFIDT